MTKALVWAKELAYEEAVTRYDKARVARQFSRAADSYVKHDYLQRRVAEVLIEQLKPSPGPLLDLGCGPAHHAPKLARCAEQYVGVDIASAMLTKAQQNYPAGAWLGADMELLPFANASFSTLYSNLAMQWGNNLSQLLREWVRVLRPGGQLLCSTVLAGSMWPLGECFAQLDGQPHHNRWHSANGIRHQLAQLPGKFEVAERHFCIDYQTLRDMLGDLKGIGANYTVRDSQAGFSKTRLQRLTAAMENYRTGSGKLELHWNIGLITGRKS